MNSESIATMPAPSPKPSPKRAPPQQLLQQALAHPLADKRIEILRHVGECGSISAAARQAGVSYKAAWQAIDTLGNLAGAALVDKAVGGSGGGGARLTAEGEQLLQAAALMAQARRDVLGQLSRSALGAVPALGLRTSMRNQLPCLVQALKPQRGAVQVQLALGDGSRMCSRITRESAELLGLAPGQRLLALCKATAVEITAQAPPAGAEINLLAGEVQRLSRSRAGGEVALRLPGGESWVGFCGPASGLRLHGPAWARFGEAAVVLALAE